MIIALVVSSVGFYKYVYFISLGYGFSVAAMGVAMFIMYMDVVGWGTIIMCALLYALQVSPLFLYSLHNVWWS